MKYSFGLSSFLKESSSLSHSIFSSISLHWSLRKTFFCLLAILWTSAFRWVYISFSPPPMVVKNIINLILILTICISNHVSSHIWHTFSHVCILFQWLCFFFCFLFLFLFFFFALYSIDCSSTASLFQTRVSGSNRKNSDDVLHTTKKCQVITI